MKRRQKVAIALVAAVGLAFYKVPALRAPFLNLACRSGSGSACVAAAKLAMDRDVGLAFQLAAHGCEKLRHAESCATLTELVAIVTPGDYPRAEKMCLEGDGRFGRACVLMAELVIIGQFGDHDRQARTLAFYGRACTLGEPEGCDGLKVAAQQLASADRLNAIAKACVDGDHDACTKMIGKFRESGATGVAP